MLVKLLAVTVVVAAADVSVAEADVSADGSCSSKQAAGQVGEALIQSKKAPWSSKVTVNDRHADHDDLGEMQKKASNPVPSYVFVETTSTGQLQIFMANREDFNAANQTAFDALIKSNGASGPKANFDYTEPYYQDIEGTRLACGGDLISEGTLGEPTIVGGAPDTAKVQKFLYWETSYGAQELVDTVKNSGCGMQVKSLLQGEGDTGCIEAARLVLNCFLSAPDTLPAVLANYVQGYEDLAKQPVDCSCQNDDGAYAEEAQPI